MTKKNKILITGSCGFIGMQLCEYLLKNNFQVFGVDSMNNYYDKALKVARLNILEGYDNFKFNKLDISNMSELEKIFTSFKPSKVVNLAAQAGVRYSIENPFEYIKSNISGFLNILECSKHHKVKGVIYASSSSVYGGNRKTPFSVEDRVDKPISIYAVSKKSNELMANTYSHLYGINTTGLRFFTVYGPWGRPDMAMYIFANKILKGEKIPLFNSGKMKRDFTYIDDIVNGIVSAINNNYHCEVFNLGNSKTEDLMDVVSILEKTLDKKADLKFLGMQPGDVVKTFADIKYSTEKLNYKPKVNVREGIPYFIKWFKKYNNYK